VAGPGVNSIERNSVKKQKYRCNSASASSQWPGWNLVIGIEVHAQLKSRRKLFSGELQVPKPAHPYDNFFRFLGSRG
jgi:hypothetical protein